MNLMTYLMLIGVGAGTDPPQTRLIAEWEPARGVMITWPLYLPCELVQALAQRDHLYVLVANDRAGVQGRAAFSDWGIDLDRVSWIQTSVESPWTRDYGAHQVFDRSGRWTIVDGIYINTPTFAQKNPRIALRGKLDYLGQEYPGDDRTNEDVAAFLKAPIQRVEAYLTGGNFLTDGLGTAFVTRAMLDENNVLMSDAAFRALVEDFLGIHRLIVLENTETWGIQHIDCFFKLLDAETILLKQVPPDHPEYGPIARNLTLLKGLKTAFGNSYKIVRIACPPYDKGRNYHSLEAEDFVPAYTNSLILNKTIYVPLFNPKTDEAALATYRAAMPGYEVLGFPFERWYYLDALHCRTRALFEDDMLTITHASLVTESGTEVVEAHVENHGPDGLHPQQVFVSFRGGEGESWRKMPLARSEGSRWRVVLPRSAADGPFSFYLEAVAADRRVHWPRTAPEGFARRAAEPAAEKSMR